MTIKFNAVFGNTNTHYAFPLQIALHSMPHNEPIQFIYFIRVFAKSKEPVTGKH
jgi:hypothetical protein